VRRDANSKFRRSTTICPVPSGFEYCIACTRTLRFVKIFERKYDALRSRNFDGKIPTSIFCDLSLKPSYVSYASFVRSHIEYASIKSNARRLGKGGADNMHRRFFLGFACRERKNLGVKKIRFCAWKNYICV
jgi:hypothetical protein